MRDDDHRAGVLVDAGFQESLARQVEVVVGLVEQEHVRAGEQQAGQPDQLLLPTAERLDRGVEIDFGQTQAAQHVLDTRRVVVAAQSGVICQGALLLGKRPIEGLGTAVHLGVAQAGLDAGQLGLQ